MKKFFFNSDKYRYYFILIIFYSFCNPIGKEIHNSRTLTLNPESITDLGLKSLIKDWSFLEIKSGKEFIGGADKVIISEERIYILDIYKSLSLFIFDKGGNHLKTINNPGRGPGEFLSPIDFAIVDETQEIIIYDQAGLKLIFFDKEGDFKFERILDFNPDAFSYSKGKFIFLLGNFEKNLGNNKLVLTDTTYTVLSSYVPIKSELIGLHYDIPTTITKNKSEFLITIPFDNSLYKVNTDLEIEEISVNFMDFNLEEKFFDRFPNKRDRYRLLIGKAYNLSTYFENNRTLFFTYRFDKGYNFYYKNLVTGKETHDFYSNIFEGMGPVSGMPSVLEEQNLVWFQQNDLLKNYINQKKEVLSNGEFEEFKKRNSTLLTLYESLKNNDNPYLLFCSIE